MLDLSGLIINQNTPPNHLTDTVSVSASTYVQYEAFTLPANIERGQNHKVPALTGFSACLNVTSLDATFTWTVETRDLFGVWGTLASGTFAGATEMGAQVWCDVYFSAEADIDKIDSQNFRIGIKDAIGISGWHFCYPTLKDVVSYVSLPNGSPVLDGDGHQFSFMYRVLGATADEGTDFLGNTYRSLVVNSDPNNLDALIDNAASADTIWLSKPNPSQFSVESLYFDLRQGGASAVIDSILIDPVTPDLQCNVYFAVGGSPGATDEEWEERVWTHITTLRLRMRDTYALPAPIIADWIKLEFTRLQARTYSPGAFQKPTTYKKFPRWVETHFLSQQDPADFSSKVVEVTHEAYDLGFKYYSLDLRQSAHSVDHSDGMSSTDDGTLNQVDAQTAAQINVGFRPYREHPALQGKNDTILGDRLTADNVTRYPVEFPAVPAITSTFVSSLNRDAVVDELRRPSMFFYVPCRHRYRIVQASYANNKAYFASLRHVLFMRERFSVETDAPIYHENTGDHFNMERNDFYISEDFELTTYDTRTS